MVKNFNAATAWCVSDHFRAFFSPKTLPFNEESPFQGLVMICCFHLALLMIIVVGLAFPLKYFLHMESF